MMRVWADVFLLVAAGAAALGFVSGIQTPEMKVGLSGIIIGMGIWIFPRILGRSWSGSGIPSRKGIPDWPNHVSTLVITSMILVLLFATLLGLVLTIVGGQVVSVIVCAVATLALFRVLVPLVGDSAKALRSLVKRKEYA